MNRTDRKMGWPLALCFLLLLQAFSAWCGAAGVDLVILHVNDTHGNLRSFEQEGKQVGGMARLATLMREIREENDGRMLLLHGGDIFSRGDPSTVYYGGEVNFRGMNRIGYDVLTPGNGEFYFGVENLLKQAAVAKFSITHANVVFRKDERLLFKPYVIKKVAGVRVAILGLGVIREGHVSARPLILRKPVETAKQIVPGLRKKADVLIALTHIGVRQDSVLAREVPEIDIIVGGHSHTRLDTPSRIPRPDGGEVVIAQARDLHRFLGRLDVRLEKDGKAYRVAEVKGRLLPVDEQIPEDAEIVKLLDTYAEPLNRTVFTSEVALENPKSGESPMGNLVAEALRAEAEAEVALLDRSAVRGGVQVGTQSLADVLKIHPWRNRVLKLSLTGAQIRQALTDRDLLAAGCRFRKVEQGITDLEIAGAPADSTRSYAVAMGEFVLAITPSLREAPFEETGHRIDTMLEAYLREREVIR